MVPVGTADASRPADDFGPVRLATVLAVIAGLTAVFAALTSRLYRRGS